MKASISRTLIIKSPLFLKKILDNNEELYSIVGVNDFIESVDNYINGCQCSDREDLEVMNEEYESISINTKFIKVLKSTLQCSSIIFQK